MCRAGGRDIGAELDPHWQRLAASRFGQTDASDCSSGSSSRHVQGGSVASSGGDSDSVGRWRSLYDAKARDHADKQQRVKEKVQRMFHAEKAAKQQRSARVRTQVAISRCTPPWSPPADFTSKQLNDHAVTDSLSFGLRCRLSMCNDTDMAQGGGLCSGAAAAPSIRHSILKKLALVPATAPVQSPVRRSAVHGRGGSQLARPRT